MSGNELSGQCHRNPNSASAKKQKQHYIGKKKRPTHKTQLIVRKEDKRLIALAFASGKMQTYRFWSKIASLLLNTECMGDSGIRVGAKNITGRAHCGLHPKI